MASVTFPVSVGGDGSTVSDDASPTTGLANGGHRTRFVPALGQVVTVAQTAVNSATSAQSSAQTALNAPGSQATSANNLSIGLGSKSFTLAQTGKAFAVGQYVQIVSASNTSNWMVGGITAFTSGTGAMTVNVTAFNGSGTASDWVISLSSPFNLPSQAGNAMKFLSTNGTLISWQYVSMDAVNFNLGIV